MTGRPYLNWSKPKTCISVLNYSCIVSLYSTLVKLHRPPQYSNLVTQYFSQATKFLIQAKVIKSSNTPVNLNITQVKLHSTQANLHRTLQVADLSIVVVLQCDQKRLYILNPLIGLVTFNNERYKV